MTNEQSGRRFCTACQLTKPDEGGFYKRCRGTRRWLCEECVQRKSVSPYKSNNPTPASRLEQIRRALYGRLA